VHSHRILLHSREFMEYSSSVIANESHTSNAYGPFHTPHKIGTEDPECPACRAFGKPDALLLFTGRSLDHLLRDGGSQSWRLSPASVRSVKYAVCFQNQYPPTNDGFYEGQVEHGTAFVVAKIAGLAEPTPDNVEHERRFEVVSGPRYLVRFSEYAEIDKPNAWQHWRNPVIYGSLGSFGIDPAGLAFQPMPARGSSSDVANPSKTSPVNVVWTAADQLPVRMTIAEAKRGLAATFGVSPDAIEITIRG
jgi:hypothetical protein